MLLSIASQTSKNVPSGSVKIFDENIRQCVWELVCVASYLVRATSFSLAGRAEIGARTHCRLSGGGEKSSFVRTGTLATQAI